MDWEHKLVRIGLAFFCFILFFGVTGFLGLSLSLGNEYVIGIFCLFLSVSSFLVLEFGVIQTGKHYRSGVDDMLLYIGTGMAVGGIWLLMNNHVDSPTFYAFVALPFFIAASIRYVDKLAVVASFITAYLFLYYLLIDLPAAWRLLLPLSEMALTAGIYFWAVNAQKQRRFQPWSDLLGTLELIAPAAFYASGNYWVVQEIFVANLQVPQIPVPWFFILFTALVPVVYLYYGLRQRNRILLNLGVAAVAASIFSFRYYNAVLPLAWAATIGGAVLFIGAWWAIRYLQSGTSSGFTYNDNEQQNLLRDIELQIVQQTLGSQAPASNTPGDQFGGGQFGGGGAGGSF